MIRKWDVFWVGVISLPLYILYFLSGNGRYLVDLLITLYRAKTQKILPNRPVDWLAKSSISVSSEDRIGSQTPNILIILADDLGFNDLHGGAGVATPHIDSIASNGITFTQAYATHATCAPSRASLLTARLPSSLGYEITPTPKFFGKLMGLLKTVNKNVPYPSIFRTELYEAFPDMVDVEVPLKYPMIAEMLQPYGYRSFFLGKWDSGFHNSTYPISRGYDESLIFALGGLPYIPHHRSSEVVSAVGISFDNLVLPLTNSHVSHNNGPLFEPARYMTDYLTDETVNLIERLSAVQKEPWHIMLAYNAPHNPFQASAEDFNHPDLAHIQDHNERVYAAMIRALDRGVGRILDSLRRTEQHHNTMVLFISDNGGAGYAPRNGINHPLRGYKATFFEGGVRVPAFLQWPAQLTKSSRHDEPIMLTDFAPTFVAAAMQSLGEVIPETFEEMFDGINLLPYLSRGSQESSMPPRPLYWRSDRYRALRSFDQKLMVHSFPDKVWFFNLSIDPLERVNIAQTVNLTSLSQLEYLVNDKALLDQCEVKEADLLCQILDKYKEMLSIESLKPPPLWQPLNLLPMCVDHRSTETCPEGEDFVYFAN
eukprot:gene5154-5671_t